MRKLLVLTCLLVISDLLFHQCANPLRPSGGPKDTIPPTLIASFPEDQTINFKAQEIRLSFSEFINADQLKQKLIITPRIDTKYKHLIKKRDLILKFEESLQDSTTYTFNFFDGVTDITERNPIENLILAISTGTYIDSLHISGHLYDLYTNEPVPKTTVGLYTVSDSLDIFSHSPYYFVNTLTDGSFELKNLRSGKFIIVAFNDGNKNLKLDPATEAYAFLNDTLYSKTNPDSLTLYQLQVDASKLKFISARPSGRYFDARYAKPLTRYKIDVLDEGRKVYSNLTEERDAVRFYPFPKISDSDSIPVSLTVYDSLNNQITDTVHVKFRSSARKGKDFTQTLLPKANSSIDQQTTFQFIFSKPVYKIDSSFASISFDTLYHIPLLINNIQSNFNNTRLTFTTNLTKTFLTDTLNKLLDLYEPDTANIDSLNLFKYQTLKRIPQDRVTIKFSKNAFISVEQDSSKSFQQSFRFFQQENVGTIKAIINTSIPNYSVQLINNKNTIQQQLYNCSTCEFPNIPPGDYSVRILVDENGNGKFDIGNIQTFTEPEPILNFPKKSALRANWVLELEYSF